MNIFICIFGPKFLFSTSVHFVHLVVMYLLQSTDHFIIIDTGLDGLDILFGPALSFCPFSAPSLRAHEIILLLAFPKFVKPYIEYIIVYVCKDPTEHSSRAAK